MPWVKCKICNADFYAKPRHLKIGWGKHCSNTCLYESMKTGTWVACSTCNKKIYRSLKELRASKSHKFFCDKSCLASWKNTHILSGEQHANWKFGENAYRAIMIRKGAPPICGKCGINDFRVLVVHHIDRNRKNNQLSNLKWLCKNCHYLEHERKTV